jgi:hypothetical protein
VSLANPRRLRLIADAGGFFAGARGGWLTGNEAEQALVEISGGYGPVRRALLALFRAELGAAYEAVVAGSGIYLLAWDGEVELSGKFLSVKELQ